MQHEETMVAGCDKLGQRQRRSPASLVDIPADDMKGRNRAEPIDHLGFADVAGMDNHVGPAKRIERLRPQQAMRIRDDADNELARAH